MMADYMNLSKRTPLDDRIKIGYALINFFLSLSGRKWNDLPDEARWSIISFAGSLN